MNCPYCYSEINDEALVCMTCKRDLYLLKPMMVKVLAFEKQMEEFPDRHAYEERISHLESLIEEYEEKAEGARNIFHLIRDVAAFLIIPLALLLISHALIAVVYDTKIIYLRIISMGLPLQFGYYLFKSQSRSVFLWFIGVVFLAIASVIGMSGITSIVDGSKIWPQNTFAWKEVLEYSASIAFSFLTGMLLGSMVYSGNHRCKANVNPFVKAIITGFSGNKLSSESMHSIIKKVNEYSGAAAAIGTTAISIITGLKHIF